MYNMLRSNMGTYDKEEEQFTPYTELCKFADAFNYHVEIEKPFVEMPNLFLKIIDSEGNEITKIALDDIASINHESASILNDLAKDN